MSEMRMREALGLALREEMERDESVILMGEDIGVFGGAFKVTEGLLGDFGPDRVMDTPISENSIVGAGVGAAMGGIRPVIEMMTVNFALLAMDQMVNHMATIPYMFNGQASVPMVLRMPGGGGHQLGPTHSHSFGAIFSHSPGALLLCPSTPADGRSMLGAAIRDPNPVIFLEHETLYGERGEVPSSPEEGPFPAVVRRAGTDITLVGVLRMAHLCYEAAEILEREHGISAEVIDPRSLRPLDSDTIIESVSKTHRLLTIEEGWPQGGAGAEIASRVGAEAFDELDAPIERITGADVPMPYASNLEKLAMPSTEKIIEKARKICEGGV